MPTEVLLPIAIWKGVKEHQHLFFPFLCLSPLPHQSLLSVKHISMSVIALASPSASADTAQTRKVHYRVPRCDYLSLSPSHPVTCKPNLARKHTHTHCDEGKKWYQIMRHLLSDLLFVNECLSINGIMNFCSFHKTFNPQTAPAGMIGTQQPYSAFTPKTDSICRAINYI